jgi:hypothetical protein
VKNLFTPTALEWDHIRTIARKRSEVWPDSVDQRISRRQSEEEIDVDGVFYEWVAGTFLHLPDLWGVIGKIGTDVDTDGIDFEDWPGGTVQVKGTRWVDGSLIIPADMKAEIAMLVVMYGESSPTMIPSGMVRGWVTAEQVRERGNWRKFGNDYDRTWAVAPAHLNPPRSLIGLVSPALL